MAAAAVMADMDIPELKQKFKLSENLQATLGVKVGSLRNIALEQVRAKLKYHSNNLLAQIDVTYNKDKTVTTNLKGGFQDNTRALTADVTLKDNEITAYGIEGSLVRNDQTYSIDVNNPVGQKPNVNLVVETKEGTHTHKSGMSYDAENNFLQPPTVFQRMWLEELCIIHILSMELVGFEMSQSGRDN